MTERWTDETSKSLCFYGGDVNSGAFSRKDRPTMIQLFTMNSNGAPQKVDITIPIQTPKPGIKALLTSLPLWIKQGFHTKAAFHYPCPTS
jgi:hypothetical protein